MRSIKRKPNLNPVAKQPAHMSRLREAPTALQDESLAALGGPVWPVGRAADGLGPGLFRAPSKPQGQLGLLATAGKAQSTGKAQKVVNSGKEGDVDWFAGPSADRPPGPRSCCLLYTSPSPRD
eukprot:3854423-Alexandrium_andersonii.AAC.1